jgi:mRNA interferase HigB
MFGPMHVISLRKLRDCWERHPKAKMPLRTWYKVATDAKWRNFAEVRRTFGSADAVEDSRVIFDVGGNKYRIVARIVYHPYYRMMIKFAGTHKEYDQIDPETV